MTDGRKRFLIVGMPRSGTTVTHRALQGHPNVMTMMDELKVEPLFTEGVSGFTVSGNNEHQRDHGYGMLIDALSMVPCSRRGVDVMGYGGTDEYPKRETLANGAKLVVSSPRETKKLVEALQQRPSLSELNIIRVVRNDLVAQCASLERARRSGRWHSFFTKEGQEKKSGSADSFEIDEEEFIIYRDSSHRIQAKLDKLGDTHPHLVLSFEDQIVSKGPEAFLPMLDFLGLPRITPTWLASSKVSPPVRDYVTNADRLYELQNEVS